jgi:hypothetical protein
VSCSPTLILVAALLLLNLPGMVLAQVSAGDILVTPQPTTPDSAWHGYVERRFEVSNLSSDRQHHVTLELPGHHQLSMSGYPYLRSVRRSLILAPRATMTVSLLQPGLPVAGSGLVVTVDRRQRRVVSMSLPGFGSSGYYAHGQESAVLATASLAAEELRETLLGAQLYLGEPDSSSWLAYSCLDGIIISSDELELLTAEVQAAIEEFVWAGGTLLVLARDDQPISWPVSAAAKAELTSFALGFGRCLVIADRSGDGTGIGSGYWTAINDHWRASATPWSFKQSYSVLGEITGLAVMDGLQIPVRGLFLLMISFAVVIGPVNLVLLKRRRRQIWLLWTIPLVSLVTSGAVFVYALASEGLTAKVRVEGLTLLDQVEQRAVTIGSVAYYSPLTPGDGLHMPLDAELTPLIQWGTSAHGRVVDWSHDQHLQSGWVTARSPAYFKWRSVCHRRERLLVRPGSGGRLEVMNGLGVNIRQLWLADGNGRRFSLTGLAEGISAQLEPVPGAAPARGELWSLRDLYTQHWYSFEREARSRIEALLGPGTYVAVVEVNPFITVGLPQYELVSSTGVIYGRFADLPAPEPVTVPLPAEPESESRPPAHAGSSR